jgi:hypothetical protein
VGSVFEYTLPKTIIAISFSYEKDLTFDKFLESASPFKIKNYLFFRVSKSNFFLNYKI